MTTQGNNQDMLPDYVVYAVVDREGQNDRWIPNGVGYNHEDGEGITFYLGTTPVNGQIVCRKRKEK